MYFRKIVVGLLLDENITRVVKPAIIAINGLELSNIKLLPKEIKTGSKSRQITSLKDVEILITDPINVNDLLMDIPKSCKWIQFTWSGLDYIKKSTVLNSNTQNFNDDFITTRMGGSYGQTMKEYVIGAIISTEGTFKLQFTAQKWMRNEILSRPFRTLDQLTVGIIGAGDIGMEIAAFLKMNGVRIHAFKKHSLPEKKVYPIDQLFLDDNLDGLLSSCDYICNILPSTSETIGLLSGNVSFSTSQSFFNKWISVDFISDRLKICSKRKPCFINIGRGDIIDDKSLLNALQQGWISHAFLDVFNEEPLPESSPFWTMPNVVVTPHVSGRFRGDMIGKIFKENLLLYLNNKPLKYIFNWQIGY